MKSMFFSILTLAVPLTCQLARSQGSFTNLNFEAANVPDVPQFQFGSDVAASNGIPGWTPYIGGVAVATILHNNENLSLAAIAIEGPSWPQISILEGSFTVLLQSSANPPTTAAVGQTGQIPVGTKSVLFYGNGAFSATFAGQPISVTPIASGQNYTIFGGDISAFAGQTGELLFQGGGLLDNISFSPAAIPEPSVVGVFAAGATLLAWRSVRRARSVTKHSAQPGVKMPSP